MKNLAWCNRLERCDVVRFWVLASVVCWMNSPALLAAPAISYVQGNYATPQTPQTTVSVTFTAAQAAGDLNVVVVGWNDSTAVVNSVTDKSGNVYTRAVGPTVLSGALSQSIYYAKNIVAAASGNTVTVTLSPAAAWPDIRIVEYSGADPSNPVDVTAAGTGNSATSTAGPATTTNPTDLIFGANMVGAFTKAAGSGFTQRINTSPDGDFVEDRMVTATGSYSATASLGTGAWVMQMVAFRTPSGGDAVARTAKRIRRKDTTPPTAPTNLTTTVSGTQINLSWTASTDNVGVTGYKVERCQGSGCTTFAQIATPTATTYSDTGLAAGNHSYRVRATDAAGNLSAYSNTASGVISDTTPPTAPSGLTATVSGSQVNLSWTASTDNVGVTGYLVERCQGSGCTTFAQIGTSTTSTYSDTGLSVASYSYRVRATDAAGNLSTYSNVASATITDTTPPTAPTNLTATVSGTQINLSWTASTDNVGVTGYKVERCQGSGCTTFAQIATPTATTYSDSGLAAGNYSYRVRATDAAGNLSGYSNVANGVIPDTTPPTAPTNLTATASGSQINLSWTASTDNVGVTGYRVERCQGTGCTTFAQIATPTGTTYSDTGLATGIYSYRVRATDAAGNLSTYSNVASATITDTTPPTAPTNLTATVSSTQINLSWTASTDNVGVTGYKVERCQGTGCTSFAQIGTPTSTTYSDIGLAAGTYSYRVRATDAAGNLSAYSNVASGVISDTQSLPSIVQVKTTGSNALVDTGSQFTVTLPNASLANNLIAVCVSWDAAHTVNGVTDNVGGNTWTAGPTAVAAADGNDGSKIRTTLYYSLNTTAGVNAITFNFNVATAYFSAIAAEFYNVATSSATDGSSAAQTAAPTIASGALTTGTAGDLIVNCFRDVNESTPNPYAEGHNFAAGSGFHFESADRAIGQGMQTQVQAGAGAINPSVTLTGETNSFNSISQAFKAASAGTAPAASGIRIMREYHAFINSSTFTIQFPTSGNLVFIDAPPSTGQDNSTVGSDSSGNVYTKKSSDGTPQMWYSCAATADLGLTIPFTVGGSNQLHIAAYDVAGAATSCFDSFGADQSGMNTANGNITDPTITPSTSNGLVFAAIAMGTGPITGQVSTGMFFDNTMYTGATDASQMDFGDGFAHFYNPNTNLVSFVWRVNSPPGSMPTSWDSVAIAFRAASAIPPE